MILADLNISTLLSLAVRSAIDVGGWADCAAVVVEAFASEPAATCFVHAGPGSRIDAELAHRIAKHSLCDVGLVGATGIPAHVPVAAVFQLAEYEQTLTTIARLKKIDLNFWCPGAGVGRVARKSCCGARSDEAKRWVDQSEAAT